MCTPTSQSLTVREEGQMGRTRRSFSFILSVLSVVIPFWMAFAEDGSGSDFWKRFNSVYDVGKSYLDGLARGDGRVSQSTGTFTYRYDIPLPPGRNGMAPSLALLYSSQGKRGFLGDGWVLNVPFIERSTKFGQPSYVVTGVNADQLLYHDENGAVHNLIPVEVFGAQVRYRMLEESEFSWFIYDTWTEMWKVLKKDGRVLEFGNRYSNATTYTSDHGLYSWYIDEDRDPNGNTIRYTYLPGSQEEVYPLEILYTGNDNPPEWIPTTRISFAYNPQNPTIRDCRRGAIADFGHDQLQSIGIFSNNVLRKQFLLFYSSVDTHKVLDQIEFKASGSDTPSTFVTLPRVTFSYNDSTPEFNPTSSVYFPSEQLKAWQFSVYNPLETEGDNTTRSTRALLDMNGDGIKDYVVSWAEQQYFDCRYKVYLGHFLPNGSLAFGGIDGNDYDIWHTPVVFGSRFDDNDDWKCPVRASVTYIGASETVMDLVDMNGDGLPDWVGVAGTNEMWVALNTGSDFSYPPQVWLFPGFSIRYSQEMYTSLCPFGCTVSLFDLVDMNGDGLVDYVDCAYWQDPDRRQCTVNLNNGSGFDSVPIFWDSPIQGLSSQFLWSPSSASIAELQDINGDGLLDLIVVYGGQFNWEHEELLVYYNLGDGFATTGIGLGITGPVSFSQFNIHGDPQTTLIKVRVGTRFLADVNSDGLPDYVTLGGGEDSCTNPMFRANLGGGHFSYTSESFVGLPSSICLDKTITIVDNSNPSSPDVYTLEKNKLVDIDGDTRLDLIVIDNSWDPFDVSTTWDCRMGVFKAGYSMQSASNGFGGSTSVSYIPSSKTPDPEVPSPVLTVDAVTRSDGFGNAFTKNMSYSGGLFYNAESDYFHPLNHEFRGFNYVTESDVDRDLEQESLYYQGNYFVGKKAYDITRRLSNPDLNSYFTKNYYSYTSIATTALWGFPDATIMLPSFVYSYVSNDDPAYGSSFSQKHYSYDSVANVINDEDSGVLLREGMQELGNTRRTVYDYKSAVDLVNNVYIYRLKRKTADRRSSVGTYFTYLDETYFHDYSSSDSYLSSGLLTKVRKYFDATSYYDTNINYDVGGLVYTIIDPENNMVAYSYDSLSRTFIHTKNRGSLSEHFCFDPATGSQTCYTDVNGKNWQYSYDGFGRLTKETWPKDDGTTYDARVVTYYDFASPTYKHELTTIDPGLYSQTRSFFDGLGRLIQKISNHNGTNNIIERVAYDNPGRLSKVAVPELIAPSFSYVPTWGAVPYTLLSYDPLDRLTQIWRSAGAKTVRTFAFGPDVGTTMSEVQGGLERTTKTLDDGHGNILKVIRDVGQGELNVVNRFEYDGWGIINAKDHSSNAIAYSRDRLGRIYHTALPGTAWDFTYDGDNNLSSSTSPAGRVINYDYDEHDRVVSRALWSGGISDGSIGYDYDGAICNLNGRLAYASSPGGSGDYCYNALGNMTQYHAHHTLSNRDYTLGFGYNSAGQVKSITYPDGAVFNYEFNQDGTIKRLKRVSSGDYIATATYNARRQLSTLTGFNLTYSYTYDTYGLLTKIKSYKTNAPNPPIMERQLSYYDNDKISYFDDLDLGDNGSVYYDALQRLSSVAVSHFAESFTIDNIDRITRNTRRTPDGNIHTIDLTYADSRFPWAATKVEDTSNGQTLTTNMSYDADGIMTGRTSGSSYMMFTYDARGLLKRSQTGIVGWMVWDYDHFDRPLYHRTSAYGSNVDLVDKYYEEGYLWNTNRKYLFFGGLRIGLQAKSGGAENLYYFHADQIGSIRYRTDQNGNILETHKYFPYGEEYQNSGQLDYFGFNDKKIEGIGLYRFPARMYQPLGYQWPSLDPGILRDPSILLMNGVNPYAYCSNDPLGRQDPTGTDSSEEDLYWRPSAPSKAYHHELSDEAGRDWRAGNYVGFAGVVLLMAVNGLNLTFGAAADIVLGTPYNAGAMLGTGLRQQNPDMVIGGAFQIAILTTPMFWPKMFGAAGGASTLQQAPTIIKGLGNVTHAGSLTPAGALGAAQRWLGTGYKEIAPGVYRSGDALRQFRMTTSDLVGAHGNLGSHIHFEALNAKGVVVENLHVPLQP